MNELNSTFAAIVPLRGGSKGIKNKNIRHLAGKPLFSWIIDEALASNVFEKIYVSTESTRIADSVQSYYANPKVQILKRDERFATDVASSEDVVIHHISEIYHDIVCLLQATSPLTISEHFVHAKILFNESNADSLVTVVRKKAFIWSSDGKPQNYDPQSRPTRQQFDGFLQENGAFYMTKRAGYEKHNCRLYGNIAMFEMPHNTEVELDEERDWHFVERTIANNQLLSKQTDATTYFKETSVIVCDVDGTLTDGAMYYDGNGEALKRFHTRDGHGLEMVFRAGFTVIVATKESSKSVDARMHKLGISNYFHGVNDKFSIVSKELSRLRKSWSDVVFIGDDVNDISCLKAAKVGVSPADGHPDVRAISDFVTCTTGGNGAVREICDYMISASNQCLLDT